MNFKAGLTQLSVILVVSENDYKLITHKRVRIFHLFMYSGSNITRF